MVLVAMTEEAATGKDADRGSVPVHPAPNNGQHIGRCILAISKNCTKSYMPHSNRPEAKIFNETAVLINYGKPVGIFCSHLKHIINIIKFYNYL